MSEYRLGRFAEAIQRVQSALRQAGTSYELEAGAQAVLAMAEWRLGQTDSARQELVKAADIAESKLPKVKSGDLGGNWLDWIFAHALLREAKELIEGGPETTAGAK